MENEWWIEASVLVRAPQADAVAELMREAGAPNGVQLEEIEVPTAATAANTVPLGTVPASGAAHDALVAAGDGSGASAQAGALQAVRVIAYYPEDAFVQGRLARAQQELAELEARTGPCRLGEWSTRRLNAGDWVDQWKQYFHVTHLPGGWVVRPEWETYDAQPGERVLSLDPDAAFGTGTHPTTALCLQALDELLTPEKVATRPVVFDVGTGSGVLAIAAAKLGVTGIRAVDIDPLAVRVARHNLALNGLTAAEVDVAQGDLLTGVTGQADLVLANLLAWIVKLLLPDLPAKLKVGGLLLTSGITEEQAPDVVAAAQAQGLELVQTWYDADWVAMLFRRVR